MDQFNPYLFPFGPNYQPPASATLAEWNDDPLDPIDLESSVASSAVPPPRNRELELEPPFVAQLAAPNRSPLTAPQKIVSSAQSAVASMILGIMSLVGFFMGISIFVALGAIVTGHLGLSRIKKSAGALTGKGMAITGLITGYAGFALSLVVIVLFVNMVMSRPARPQFGQNWDEDNIWEEALAADNAKIEAREAALAEVEGKLEAASANSAHGNTAQAKKLAEDFNIDLKVMATKGPGGPIPALQDLTFSTHCELHEDRAAFMVVVHGSDRGADPEKVTLKELSWITACFVLRQSLPDSHHVALNLRNPSGSIVSLYGTVADTRPLSEIDRDSLAQFYAESEDDLIGISPIVMQQYPNRGLQGRPPADLASATPRPQLGGPTLPSSRPPSSRPSRSTFSPGIQLKAKLNQAPPSGLRPQGHTLPPYTDQTLALNSLDYALLVLDTSRSPGGGGYRRTDITAACFSPDGKQLAVGIDEGELLLYQLEEERVFSFPPEPGTSRSILTMAYSPDGKKLFISEQNGSLCYRNVENPEAGGRPVTLTHPRNAADYLVVSADGGTLFCAVRKEIFKLSANPGGAIQNFAEGKFALQRMTLDEDGSGLLYTDGKELTRVDLKTQTKEALLDWKRLFFRPCDISPAAKLVASYEQHTIYLRTFDDGRNDSFPPETKAVSMRFTPQGDRLVITRSGTVSVWDVKETTEIATFRIDTNFDPLVRDISPDGKFAAVQNHLRDSVLYILPLPDAIKPESSETPAVETRPAANAQVAPDSTTYPEVAATVPSDPNPFSPDAPDSGATTTDSTPADADIKQISINDHIVAVFRDLPPGIEPIAFSPAVSRLIVGKGENQLLCFDLAKNSKQPVSIPNLGKLSALCYSLDGNVIFAGTKSGKIFALAIDEAGRLVNQREMNGHQSEVTSLIAGLNAKFIASAGQDNRVVWQQLTINGKLREASLAGSPVVQLCELPGQATVLATDGKQYTRVSLASATSEVDQPLSKFAKSAGQISPDARFVATVDGSTIRTWNLAAEKPLATMAMNGSISSVHFTPDGKYLLAVAGGKVTLFHPHENEALAEFVFPRGSEIHRLTISPDGKQFAAYIDSLGKALYVVSLAGLEDAR